MKKVLSLAGALVACAGSVAVAAPAQAVPQNNPVRACEALAAEDPETYGFIATQPGACVSTAASVGLDAVLQEHAFPSRPAAIGNCKGLEGGNPADFYPYAFYGEFLSTAEGAALFLADPELSEAELAALAAVVSANYNENIDAFTADNRAECVEVLKGLHSGELFGLLFPAGP